jgi:PAS domain S-box-containing protein
MPDVFKSVLVRNIARYAMAAGIVAASYLLRFSMERALGVQLPTFLTFYPAVFFTAIVAGLWPGLLATAAIAVGADYLIMPPIWSFSLASRADLTALVFFTILSVCTCLLAEHYRRSQQSIAAYKAEQALWQTNEKLAAAMTSMTDAVFIIDADGQFTHFNDAYATFLRYASKDECAQNFSFYPSILEIHKMDGPLVPPEMWPVQRALRGESAVNVEYKLRRKDTGATWIASYSFNPLRDSDGSVIGAVVVARDITEKKVASQKLRDSERELSLIYRNMHDIVFYMAVEPGGQFRFISVNPIFLQVTGLESAHVIGKLAQEVIPEPSAGMVLEKYNEAVLEKRTVTWEETTIFPAGEKHANVSITPVFNEQGECTNLIGVVHDITERKQAEDHIRQLNRVLSVLSDINQTIVREKDCQAMLEAACRIAVEKGEFRMAWIGMFDPVARVLTPFASSGAVDGYLDRVKIDLQNSAHDSGPTARCVRSGNHALCNDIEHDPTFSTWRDEALDRGYRSSGSFPLKVDGQIVGVFNLYAANPGFFEGDELNLLDEMAKDIGFALEVNRREQERQKAEETVRQFNRIYAVLSDINETIVREKDSHAMLQAACHIAIQKGNFRMAWVGMVNDETHVLEPVAFGGEVGSYLDRVRIDLQDLATATGPAARSFHSGEHSVCNDIEHELYRPWKEYAIELGYRSMAAFPLRADGRVVGVFNLYASEPDFFEEDELKLLDEMAMDIGFALEVNRREEARRRTEEELRWRTAFFEAQVYSSPDGMLVVDNQGKKILQNRRMNDLLKIPPHIYENPDDAQQVRFVTQLMKNPDAFLEKVNHMDSHPEEVSRDQIELLDGTILDRYSAPVRDKANVYYGRIWIFRDITGQRQLEEQYRQAQKMEAIGQLTGGIAHDFNNLLTVIMGCSEAIGDEVKQNPHLAKMAEMILGAGRRGAEMTHRMLAFARRQTLQPRAVNVYDLLVDMKSFLHRTLRAEIELKVVRGKADCMALVDPAELENALLNLCVNAQDAMPGGGKLTIETDSAEVEADYSDQNPEIKPGNYVLIKVTDTGCGISPQNLRRVFDPFFTTKEVGKGTGLGLSMVYGFAQQSQGHVKIYSELGRGTTVKLFLPCAQQKSAPKVPRQAPIADLRGSEVVLLVEDDGAVREFAKSQLESLGYSVLEAANGKNALKILKERGDIDLLFTDMVMPGGMNGRELAQKARKLRPALKVLYCSGYARTAIIDQGLMDKDAQLLDKPYSRKELARRVRMALAEGQPR